MESTDFKKIIEQIFNKEKGLSFSSLKEFLQSPKHFFKYKTDKKTTPAMEEGKQFHTAILEPAKFKEQYWVLDDAVKCAEIGGKVPRNTKLYKEWKQEQINANAGRELIGKEDYDIFLEMGEYLYKCSATKWIMEGLVHKEKDFEFEHKGFKITGKIDGEGITYLMDLKKMADASFKKIKWAIFDMRYNMQGAIYSAAADNKDYYLVCIDKGINVTVVKISKDTLQLGWEAFECALSEFQRCMEEDSFDSSYEFFNNGYIEI